MTRISTWEVRTTTEYLVTFGDRPVGTVRKGGADHLALLWKQASAYYDAGILVIARPA